MEIAKSISSQTNDSLGATISLCAKMNSMASPNGMVIGTNLYQIIKEHYFDDYNFEELDDEPDALFTYKTFLASEGFKVDAFTLPEEALKMCATKNPSHYSLVIVDIRMPSLNGLQLYHRLKAMSISAKVLFVSALDAAGELISILPDASDMRFIKKPADQEHFMAAVRALLGSHG